MSDQSQQENCRMEIIGRDIGNGPVVHDVNLQGTEEWWVHIQQGGHLVLKQVGLGLSSTEMPDFGGYWCWIRNNKGTLNGTPVYAMESFTYPRMFWSLERHTIGHQPRLTHYTRGPRECAGHHFQVSDHATS